LSVNTYHVGRVRPLTPESLEASQAKLAAMNLRDRERIMLEESRNKVESYIYFIKNKLIDDEESITSVTTEDQREECRKLAADGADWLDMDSYGANLATMEDKYAELSVPFEKIMLRVTEKTKRPKVIEVFNKKLDDIESLMAKWESEKPQVTEEERSSVLKKVDEARKWLEEKESLQTKKASHEDPAFVSDEILLQLLPIEPLVVRLGKKPKPKPPKIVITNATDSNKTSDANETDSSGVNATSPHTMNSTEVPGSGNVTDVPPPGSGEEL
jgi:hypoxia up-regulated 1